MKTPYEILDVAANASDSDIKQAYLQKVKDNPPDRDQEQFQIIHAAYTNIKDHKSRISYDLFNLPAVEFDELLDQALTPSSPLNITAEYFNQLLNAGVNEATLSNIMSSSEKS